MKHWEKLKQSTSKCMNKILYTPTNNEPERQQISQKRTTNYEIEGNYVNLPYAPDYIKGIFNI